MRVNETGFPNPAADAKVKGIDLNKTLIPKPSSTFLMRVAGSAMKNAGIYSGDTLIVDKSLVPKNQDIVVAAIDGEFTIKRIQYAHGRMMLMSENARYRPIQITDDQDIHLWGVVTYVIHRP